VTQRTARLAPAAYGCGSGARALRRRARAAWLCWAAFAGGCQPSLESEPALVTGARVLAVKAEPAEQRPNAEVMFSALVASAEAGAAPELDWAFCSYRRRAADANSVAAECLRRAADWIEPIGSGPSSEVQSARVPGTACELFGSEPAPAEPGEPPARPADPDRSGGYYQPLRVRLAGEPDSAFGQLRVRCALPGASVEVARAYTERYQANQNTVLERFAVTGSEPRLRRGQSVELTTSWSAQSFERYVVYERAANRVTERREELELSWFMTGGSLGRERVRISAGTTTLVLRWTAPERAGSIQLWAVARDERGGVDFATTSVEVGE